MNSRRSTVLALAALTLLLTAGTAQSLAGTDTVFSDDIVDGTIVHADVKANSLGGSRFMDNSVTSGKILNGTVTGTDIKDSTITGDDVNELSLDMGLVFGTTVAANGDFKYAGNALEVNKDGIGSYFVKFSQDMTGCTPIAQAAGIVGRESANVASDGTVLVTIMNDQGVGTDAEFKLIVACAWSPGA